MEDYNEVLEGFEDTLFGIGAAEKMIVSKLKQKGITPDPKIVSAVKEASAKRAQQLITPLTKAQRLLLSKANELDSDTRSKLASGKLQIQDGDLYIRKDISGGSGKLEILNASTTYQRGVSSFQGNKLADNVNLMMDRVAVSYGTGATGAAVASVRYSSDGQRIAAALSNAEFVLLIDEKPALVARMNRFFSDGTTAMVPNMRADNFALMLPAPKLIKSGSQIGIEIRFPEGQSLSTAVAHLIEVSLMGAITGTRTTD